MGRVWMPGGGGGADLDVITAGAGDVLAGKVIVDKEGEPVAGTMPDRGVRVHGTDNGVNEDGIWTRIPYGYYRDGNREDSWVYRSASEMKETVKNAYGIASVTNFRIAQYNSRVPICIWANPGNGRMWSGVVIRCKQGGYPSSPWDGTEFCGGTVGTSVAREIGTGVWHFKYWNYVTVNAASGGRWYDGGHDAGVFDNKDVKGTESFTSSGSWTVPEGVRSITIFAVGGGGGGSGPEQSGYGSYIAISGGGGGGGYTAQTNVSVSPGERFDVVVGAGGNRYKTAHDGAVDAQDGGNSTVYRGGAQILNANGGVGGIGGRYGLMKAGDGGSGGGVGGSYPKNPGDARGGDGGSDGGDGKGYKNTGTFRIGIGQHSTTRFDGVLYGGGGGGSLNGVGGAGGGGNGSTRAKAADGTNGLGGGGGGGHQTAYIGYFGGNGGSGAVVFKWG